MDMGERKCARCGNELSEEELGELCPYCLMSAGMPSDAAAGEGDSVPAELSREALARDFPDFEILELLGCGGMGVVYKVRQKSQQGRLAALKVLSPKLKKDPAFAERFAREGRALSRLTHPNIVSIYDAGESNGRLFLLMEYVDGMNLRQALREGRFSPEEALAVVPRLCEALQYAHEQGVVHRDIKPENILIDRHGEVKIVDFGLAKLLNLPGSEFTLTETRQRMGTPHYMAPEQIGAPQQVDHRADIFALGVVFYEMLTGELPLGRFAPPSKKVQVDVRLDEVVLRALENEPQRRYQSAREVKSDIESIAGAPGAVASNSGSAMGDVLKAGCVTLLVSGLLLTLVLVCIAIRQGKGVTFTLRLGKPSSAQTPICRSATAEVAAPVVTFTPTVEEEKQKLEKAWAEVRAKQTSESLFVQTSQGLLMKTLGGESWPVAPGSDWIGKPRLSPDRQELWAIVHSYGRSAYYITRFGRDGSVEFVRRVPNGVGYFDVSPDGKSIVLGLSEDYTTSTIVLKSLPDGEEQVLLPVEDGGHFPMFSPDGKMIAYCAYRKLWVLDLCTRMKQVIVSDDLAKELPSWSPDGQWIAYQASAGDRYSYDIYKVRVADGHVERLTHELGADANPCFSADGKRIAFGSERGAVQSEEKKLIGNRMALYTMNADDTNVQRDPTSPDHMWFPRW